MNKNQPLSLPADAFEIATPFEGDQLGRDALATQLGGYIDRLKAGAVLGIDAPWGEGKTWFGRNWAERLKADHKVAFIDAYENDFVDDPFLLIASDLSSLLDDAQGQGRTLRKKAAGVLKAIVPMGTKAVINLAGRLLVGTSDLSDEISEAAKEATGKAADEAGKWIEKRIEEISAERASLIGFRLELADAASKCERPIVVFIDELDRCRPSFAVTLIERIKHLFDVPNLVFILLLNRRQMEVAIEGQYGPGTDGQAYLGKFVSLWFELPKATPGAGHSDNRVIAYTDRVLSRYGFDSKANWNVESVRQDFVFWATAFNLSLRDIDRMCALFVLANRNNTALLAYLIATKVKHPRRFAGIRRNDSATHLECSKTLLALAGNKEAVSSDDWPDTMLVSLAQMHQIQRGDIESKDATMFNRWRTETCGNFRDVGRAFVVTANAIDLPIESY